MRQKRYGIRKQPLTAAIAAGDVAGAWGKFGGMGARLTSLANLLAAAPRTNQVTAARLVATQDREWQRTPRGRHDVKRIESKLQPAEVAANCPSDGAPTSRLHVKERRTREERHISCEGQGPAGEIEKLTRPGVGGTSRNPLRKLRRKPRSRQLSQGKAARRI